MTQRECTAAGFVKRGHIHINDLEFAFYLGRGPAFDSESAEHNFGEARAEGYRWADKCGVIVDT